MYFQNCHIIMIYNGPGGLFGGLLGVNSRTMNRMPIAGIGVNSNDIIKMPIGVDPGVSKRDPACPS